jgi:carboxypeptidase PM20D1
LFNAYNFKPNQLEVAAVEKVAVNPNAVDHITEAISIRTVSFADKADFDSTQFRLFNEFLVRTYPQIHEKLPHQTFNEFSHLYKWTGKNTQLDPIILMAHFDVVPIASPALWSVHPFTEGVKNDSIYGRGAMDDKMATIGILEAVEQLLVEGFQPERTIYLSFGHDEEVLGALGAIPIAKYLKEQGVKAHFVLDEGQAIAEGLIPGVDKEIALIGVAEKGYVSLELEVNLAGGHSSMPAKETSIDVLAAAISKAKKNPMPAYMSEALEGFMDKIGPEMDFKTKLAFANRNIFKSMILSNYEKSSNNGNASIRTTTSPTIFEAGIKENVIPTAARATINFRIIPGETVEDVVAHIRNVVADERVQITVLNKGSNPTPVSPIDGLAYETIDRSIKEIYDNVVTGPNLVVGATDARHFSDLSTNVYRFTPFHVNEGNLTCFHGVDERIGVEEFKDGIRFYRRVIINGSK